MVCGCHKHAHYGDNGRKDKTLLQPKKDKNRAQKPTPWTDVLAFLGLISMAQLADELWVPTWSRENECDENGKIKRIKRTESLSSRVYFRFQFPHKTKRFRQGIQNRGKPSGLPRFCQFYKGVSILNIGFKIHNKASRVLNRPPFTIYN